MFLALVDAGKERDLEEVARSLLNMLRRSYLDVGQSGRSAKNAWAHGIKEPDSTRPDTEHGYRSYAVIQFTVEAINRSNPKSRIGEEVVCQVIRRVCPLAPEDFSKTGKSENDEESGWSPLDRLATLRALSET